MLDFNSILGSKKKKNSFLSPFKSQKPVTILGDKITRKQKKILKSRSIKRKFTDWDKDGVINGLDCQPRNRKRHSMNKTMKNKIGKIPALYTDSYGYKFDDPKNKKKLNWTKAKRLTGITQHSKMTRKKNVLDNTIKYDPSLIPKIKQLKEQGGRILVTSRHQDTTGSYDWRSKELGLGALWTAMPKKERAEILHHELHHAKQGKGKNDFHFTYEKQTREHGYYDAPIEKEARKEAAKSYVKRKYQNLTPTSKKELTKELSERWRKKDLDINDKEYNQESKENTKDMTSYNYRKTFDDNKEYEANPMLMHEYSRHPYVKRNEIEKGRCEEAASCISYDAKQQGVDDEDIEVHSFTAKNYRRGGESSHVVAKVKGKYQDPTKTQFHSGNYKVVSEDIDPNYTNKQIQNEQTFIKHGEKISNNPDQEIGDEE